MKRPYKRRKPDTDALALLARAQTLCATCRNGIPWRAGKHISGIRSGKVVRCDAVAERTALHDIERRKASAPYAERVAAREKVRAAEIAEDAAAMERLRQLGRIVPATVEEWRSLERLRRQRAVKYDIRKRVRWDETGYLLRGKRKDAAGKSLVLRPGDVELILNVLQGVPGAWDLIERLKLLK